MDKILDKEVHQSYKAPSLVTYLTSKSPSSQASSGPSPVASGHSSHTASPTHHSHVRRSDIPPPRYLNKLEPSHSGATRTTVSPSLPLPSAQVKAVDDCNIDRNITTSSTCTTSTTTSTAGTGARPKTTYTLTYPSNR